MAQAVTDNLSRSLFVFFDNLPDAAGSHIPAIVITAVSLLATLVVTTFFVTSSDSGSLVIDMITAGGNPNPPVAQRIFWAVTEGIVAAALLIGGGLTALQTAAIATGLPFALVLVFMIFSLYRALAKDQA
jgi:choline/glycine/proline betaine transport protein